MSKGLKEVLSINTDFVTADNKEKTLEVVYKGTTLLKAIKAFFQLFEMP